jgi:uncharacterized protein YodC (DUF2158 family)
MSSINVSLPPPKFKVGDIVVLKDLGPNSIYRAAANEKLTVIKVIEANDTLGTPASYGCEFYDDHRYRSVPCYMFIREQSLELFAPRMLINSAGPITVRPPRITEGIIWAPVPSNPGTERIEFNVGLKTRCTCDLTLLMRDGCKCGGV